jgi:hypothetical protein
MRSSSGNSREQSKHSGGGAVRRYQVLHSLARPWLTCTGIATPAQKPAAPATTSSIYSDGSLKAVRWRAALLPARALRVALPQALRAAAGLGGVPAKQVVVCIDPDFLNPESLETIDEQVHPEEEERLHERAAQAPQ